MRKIYFIVRDENIFYLCNLMELEAYVINLERDINNYYDVEKEFQKVDISCNRFDAIYGKDIVNYDEYKNYITTYFQYFVPKSVVGSGLSHYKIMESVYDLNEEKEKDKKEPHEFALIVEDDVKVNFSKDEINTLLQEIPHDCDVCILNTFSNFDNIKKQSPTDFIKKDFFGIVPAVAYIVRVKSIPKILQKKLFYYFDLLTFNFNSSLNVYVYRKNILTTDNETSYNADVKNKNEYLYTLILNILMFFTSVDVNFLSFKIFHVPYLQYEFTSYELIKYIFVISLLYIIYRVKFKKHLIV